MVTIQVDLCNDSTKTMGSSLLLLIIIKIVHCLGAFVWGRTRCHVPIFHTVWLLLIIILEVGPEGLRTLPSVP